MTDEPAGFASVGLRAATAWGTLASYGLMTWPLNFVLALVGVSDVVDNVAIALVGFAVSVGTYKVWGADIGKRMIGLQSVSYPSLEPIELGQAVIRSLHLLAFGAASVVDTAVGFDDGVLAAVAIGYFVASGVSIAVTDKSQSLTELLASSVTLDSDPD